MTVMGQTVSVRLSPEKQPVTGDHVTESGVAVTLFSRRTAVVGCLTMGAPGGQAHCRRIERSLNGQVRFE